MKTGICVTERSSKCHRSWLLKFNPSTEIKRDYKLIKIVNEYLKDHVNFRKCHIGLYNAVTMCNRAHLPISGS